MLTFKDEWGIVVIPQTGARITCPGCGHQLMGKNAYGKEDGRKNHNRPHWAHFAHQNKDCPEVKKLNKRIINYLDSQLGPVVEKKVLPAPQYPSLPAAVNEPRTLVVFNPNECQVTEYIIIDCVEDMANMLCTKLYAERHYFIFNVEKMPEVFGYNDRHKGNFTWYTFYVKKPYACMTWGKMNLVLWLESKELLHQVTDQYYDTNYFACNHNKITVEKFNRYLLSRFGRRNAFPF